MAKLPNIHPGEILSEDYLQELEMSPHQLAQGLGVRQAVVTNVLSGKESITPQMALRLSRFLGSSPEFWLNLQAAYDLREAREKLGDTLTELQPHALSSA